MPIFHCLQQRIAGSRTAAPVLTIGATDIEAAAQNAATVVEAGIACATDRTCVAAVHRLFVAHHAPRQQRVRGGVVAQAQVAAAVVAQHRAVELLLVKDVPLLPLACRRRRLVLSDVLLELRRSHQHVPQCAPVGVVRWSQAAVREQRRAAWQRLPQKRRGVVVAGHAALGARHTGTAAPTRVHVPGALWGFKERFTAQKIHFPGLCVGVLVGRRDYRELSY